jgi:hypothetical protein
MTSVVSLARMNSMVKPVVLLLAFLMANPSPELSTDPVVGSAPTGNRRFAFCFDRSDGYPLTVVTRAVTRLEAAVTDLSESPRSSVVLSVRVINANSTAPDALVLPETEFPALPPKPLIAKPIVKSTGRLDRRARKRQVQHDAEAKAKFDKAMAEWNAKIADSKRRSAQTNVAIDTVTTLPASATTDLWGCIEAAAALLRSGKEGGSLVLFTDLQQYPAVRPPNIDLAGIEVIVSDYFCAESVAANSNKKRKSTEKCLKREAGFRADVEKRKGKLLKIDPFGTSAGLL